MRGLQEVFEEMMDNYCELKERIRSEDKHLYERWKAGGFLVDDDILSMYPALGYCVEQIVGGSSDWHGNFYSEWDEESASYCVFNTFDVGDKEAGFAFARYASEEEAEIDVERRNQE